MNTLAIIIGALLAIWALLIILGCCAGAARADRFLEAHTTDDPSQGEPELPVRPSLGGNAHALLRGGSLTRIQ